MVIANGDQGCGEVTLSAAQHGAFNQSVAAAQRGGPASWSSEESSSGSKARLEEIVRQAAPCRDPMYAAQHVNGECNPQRLSQLLAESRQIKLDLAKGDPDKQAELKQNFTEGNRRIQEKNQRYADRNRTLKCKPAFGSFGGFDCQ